MGKRSNSPFDITLLEILKALHKRRSEINTLVRSLEAVKYNGSGRISKPFIAQRVQGKSKRTGNARDRGDL
jgi:hypothetical protein